MCTTVRPVLVRATIKHERHAPIDHPLGRSPDLAVCFLEPRSCTGAGRSHARVRTKSEASVAAAQTMAPPSPPTLRVPRVRWRPGRFPGEKTLKIATQVRLSSLTRKMPPNRSDAPREEFD